MDPIQTFGKKNMLTVFFIFIFIFFLFDLKCQKGPELFISGQMKYSAMCSKYEIELFQNNVVH